MWLGLDLELFDCFAIWQATEPLSKFQRDMKIQAFD